MEDSNAKKALLAIKTDPRAVEALKDLVKPMDEEGILRYYADASRRLGLDATVEDFRKLSEEAGQERAEKTEGAVSQIEALPDEELDSVAGGKNTYKYEKYDECSGTVGINYVIITCGNTFEQKENCWSNDACDENTNFYTNYLCNHNFEGTHCQKTARMDCDSFMF